MYVNSFNFIQYIQICIYVHYVKVILEIHITRLVIGTIRTVGSAKKFVRITSGVGWRRVHEDASQGMYMSKIEISFFTARILQNQRMLCCGECFHD